MKRIAVLAGFVAVVLIIAYTVITLYDEHLKVGRMWETPAVHPHEQKLLIMQPGVVPWQGGEATYRTAEPEDLVSPFAGVDAEVVMAGRTLYFTYCAQCHGKYFDGNGTVGQSFHPLPTNLREPTVQSKSDGALFKSISYGVPGGRQPPLATTIKILDRWRIIAFLKSLPPKY
jgi:hypothetical protein